MRQTYWNRMLAGRSLYLMHDVCNPISLFCLRMLYLFIKNLYMLFICAITQLSVLPRQPDIPISHWRLGTVLEAEYLLLVLDVVYIKERGWLMEVDKGSRPLLNYIAKHLAELLVSKSV